MYQQQKKAADFWCKMVSGKHPLGQRRPCITSRERETVIEDKKEMTEQLHITHREVESHHQRAGYFLRETFKQRTNIKPQLKKTKRVSSTTILLLKFWSAQQRGKVWKAVRHKCCYEKSIRVTANFSRNFQAKKETTVYQGLQSPLLYPEN